MAITDLVDDISRIDDIEATANAASGFATPILSAPAFVYGGQVAVFTITNYSGDIDYIITGNDGTLGSITDNTFTWTFTASDPTRNQELYVKATKDGYTDSPSSTLLVEVVYFPVVEDQALIYTGASMANFDELVNTEIVANEIVATAIDTTNIVEGYGNGVTQNTLDVLGDGSCIATYNLDGDATDLSGTYNGTATNVTYAAGKFDNAAVFNGVSSAIQTGYNPSGDFSISCWINSATATTNTFSFAVGSLISGTSHQYYIRNEGGLIELGGYDGAAKHLSGTAINNVWQHAVLVSNAGVFTAYLDGLSLGAGIAHSVNVGTQQLILGALQNSTNLPAQAWYSGSIDQARVFNKALTQLEVTTIYAEGAESFTTSTQVLDGDTINIDGTDVVASGVTEDTGASSETSNPAMTSATTPYGAVFASSFLNAPYQAFNHTAADWASDTNPFPATIGYTDITARKIVEVGVISSTPDGYPKDFIVQGSNDNTNWDNLKTISNKTDWTVGQEYNFVLDTPSAYTGYRLYITANGGRSTVNIQEILLYEEIDIYTVPTTGTATTAYINQHTATVGTPIDQDSGETDFVGLDDGSTPFTQDLKFTNISTATATDVLTTTTQIKDGDDLVIVKDDGSVVEYDGISGVSNEEIIIVSETKATPNMTSNTTPSGVASASSSYNATYAAWNAFSGASGYWVTSGGAGWLQYQFLIAETIHEYSITSAASVTESPKDWTLSGSNTGAFTGEETLLDTVSGEVSWVAGEKRTFVVDDFGSFLYYRLIISLNNGGSGYSCGELELFAGTDALKYSYTLNPTISEIPTRAYAVDSKTKFNVGDTGFVEAVKASDVYTYTTRSVISPTNIEDSTDNTGGYSLSYWDVGTLTLYGVDYSTEAATFPMVTFPVGTKHIKFTANISNDATTTNPYMKVVTATGEFNAMGVNNSDNYAGFLYGVDQTIEFVDGNIYREGVLVNTYPANIDIVSVQIYGGNDTGPSILVFNDVSGESFTTTRTYNQLLTGTGRTLQTQIELESEGDSTSRLSATVLKGGL